ncbi:MAG: segregation/condensation protein A [Deltaproteobacteria bacterium]|nr:MAG: segregation/condensation protein A [Deltaproteobacteria bacterium]
MESYRVKVDVFEGPLDLLLHLIKRNQLDIYDIPIALITEQYLEYIRLMKALDLNIAGEFLLMAATLMYIKSRMLLPSPVDEGEDEEEDPRTELVHRLLEYKKFKEAAEHLSHREILERDVFVRFAEEIEVEEGEIEANLFHLIDALRDLLQRREVEEFHEVTLGRITLKDKIKELWEKLQGAGEAVPFSSLFSPVASRDELIITFLALLDLIKAGMLRAYQRDVFGPLWITRALI